MTGFYQLFSLVISGEVAQMVSPSDNKIPLAVDRNKIFLPWSNYRYYFMWGFPDHSARIAAVDTDRVSGQRGKKGEREREARERWEEHREGVREREEMERETERETEREGDRGQGKGRRSKG